MALAFHVLHDKRMRGPSSEMQWDQVLSSFRKEVAWLAKKADWGEGAVIRKIRNAKNPRIQIPRWLSYQLFQTDDPNQSAQPAARAAIRAHSEPASRETVADIDFAAVADSLAKRGADGVEADIQALETASRDAKKKLDSEHHALATWANDVDDEEEDQVASDPEPPTPTTAAAEPGAPPAPTKSIPGGDDAGESDSETRLARLLGGTFAQHDGNGGVWVTGVSEIF